MNDKELKNVEVIEDVIKSDNTEFFSIWGSGNPLITIKEEIDNQLSAEPERAEMNIISIGGITSTITTWNDGETLSPEGVKMLNHIGRTYSSGRNASICGVGQVEGLVAGRMSPTSTSTLTFDSVKDGKRSTIVIEANGNKNSLVTRYTNSGDVDESDYVSKKFDGMRRITTKELEYIKAMIGVKIYPYSCKNKNFKYFFNGEEIKPIDVLYGDVESDSIKRFNKTYKINYRGFEYDVKVGMVDVSRYVKPDGKNIKDSANDWDKYHQLSQEGCGVFVELGGSNVILGGRDSWKLLDEKTHTTKNGIYICIEIPNGELKKAIFSESANKSEVGTKCLYDIVNRDSTPVFEEMIGEIVSKYTSWIKGRSVITEDGAVERDESNEIFEELCKNKEFREKVFELVNIVSPKQRGILYTRKVKTVVNECIKKIEMEKKMEKSAEASF